MRGILWLMIIKKNYTNIKINNWKEKKPLVFCKANFMLSARKVIFLKQSIDQRQQEYVLSCVYIKVNTEQFAIE